MIMNCAVLQVDESERDLAKAQAINVDGPCYLAEAASEVGAEIVHFSTQYAFAGEPLERAPYTIKDEPNPVNVYGRTKVAGEAAVRNACARSYIVRTSWVYGSGKKSFLCDVHHDLRAGKKVRAIDDIWSSTTYVADLIDRVMKIRTLGRYGTYQVVTPRANRASAASQDPLRASSAATGAVNWNTGVMEYWSSGFRIGNSAIEFLMPSTPSLQYSITPTIPERTPPAR